VEPVLQIGNDDLERSKESNPGRAPQLFLRCILIGSLLIVLVSYLFGLLDLTRKNYGEGGVLAVVERMRREPVSSSWLSGSEITLCNYGPGFHWAVLALSPMTPWDHTLLPGRLLSFGSVLATAMLIAVFVGRRTGKLEVGLVSSLLFLTSPYTSVWAIRHNVDGLALLFSMAAYLAVGLKRRGIVGSAFLIAIGSLVKQTVALSALAIFAHLLLCRRYKDALIYSAAVSSLGGIFWLVLNWTSGGYFFASAVAGNLMPMSFSSGLSMTHVFLLLPVSLAAVIVIAVAFVRGAAVLRSLYCLAFCVSVLIASQLASKVGSDTNYFLEATALAAVVIGLDGLLPLWTSHPRRAGLVLGAVTLALILPTLRHLGDTPDRWRHFLLRDPELSDLVGQKTGKPVLVDGEHIDLLFRAGYRPVVNDPLQFWLLAEKGTVQLASVLDAVQRGDVPYLVLAHPIQWHRERLGMDGFLASRNPGCHGSTLQTRVDSRRTVRLRVLGYAWNLEDRERSNAFGRPVRFAVVTFTLGPSLEPTCHARFHPSPGRAAVL